MLVMKIRYIWVFLVGMIFSGAGLAAQNLPTSNKTAVKSLNGIAAIVNSDIITQQQLDHAIYAARKQLQRNNIQLPDEGQFKKEVLQQLIYQRLQLDIAKRNKIKASDKDIDQAISNIASRNNLTVAELKAKLVQQGLTYAVFRKQLRNQLIITKLQREAILSTIQVNKSDIAAYRKEHAAQTNPLQYDVAHILIPLPNSASAAQTKKVKAKAEHILKKIRAGKSFDSFVNTYAGSGDLGWRALSDLPTIFADQVAKMKKGAINGPIQAANGFHIIKLNGTRQKDAYTNQQIRSLIMQQKFQVALQKWLKKLYDSAYIHIS